MRGARKNNALGRNEDSKLALRGAMTWIGPLTRRNGTRNAARVFVGGDRAR